MRISHVYHSRGTELPEPLRGPGPFDVDDKYLESLAHDYDVMLRSVPETPPPTTRKAIAKAVNEGTYPKDILVLWLDQKGWRFTQR